MLNNLFKQLVSSEAKLGTWECAPGSVLFPSRVHTTSPVCFPLLTAHGTLGCYQLFYLTVSSLKLKVVFCLLFFCAKHRVTLSRILFFSDLALNE